MGLLGGCRAKEGTLVCVCVWSWRRWEVFGDSKRVLPPSPRPLPTVIFLVMQRSPVRRQRVQAAALLAGMGPAHRLTGCHNKPTSSPCSLEQSSGKPTASAAKHTERLNIRHSQEQTFQGISPLFPSSFLQHVCKSDLHPSLSAGHLKTTADQSAVHHRYKTI